MIDVYNGQPCKYCPDSFNSCTTSRDTWLRQTVHYFSGALTDSVNVQTSLKQGASVRASVLLPGTYFCVFISQGASPNRQKCLKTSPNWLVSLAPKSKCSLTKWKRLSHIFPLIHGAVATVGTICRESIIIPEYCKAFVPLNSRVLLIMCETRGGVCESPCTPISDMTTVTVMPRHTSNTHNVKFILYLDRHKIRPKAHSSTITSLSEAECAG